MIGRAAFTAMAMLAAEPQAPRCAPFDASFTLAARQEEPGVKQYLDCLGTAEKRYGNNNGPFAVSECGRVRSKVLAGYPAERQESIAFLVDQIDREHVWLTWCSTDDGRALPPNIEIRADWPQASSTRNNNASNR